MLVDVVILTVLHAAAPVYATVIVLCFVRTVFFFRKKTVIYLTIAQTNYMTLAVS